MMDEQYRTQDEEFRILIVEDEQDIAGFLKLEFEHEGYEVKCCHDGRSALEEARGSEWHLIILDIMLPGINGMEICRRIRADSDVPIIMLTARHTVPDKVAGLDSGADDYVVKPFAIEELLARVRALIRRNVPKTRAEQLRAGGVVLDRATREVSRENVPIQLTAREFDLLEVFMVHRNHVLTRQQILELVWGYDFVGETNVVDVYVRYLRTKVDVPFDTQLIQTVRGVGYIFKA
ncbi:response regulator transcription factor [Alicyclobacillus mengziensis]